MCSMGSFKPKYLLPTAVSAGSGLLGIGPTMSNLLAMGTGALVNKKNRLGGAASGLLQGPLGAGIAGGLRPSTVGVEAGMANPMWKGFQLGMEGAIPFKNALFNSETPITGSWNKPNFMQDYYANPPAGSAVARLKNSMSPADYQSMVTGEAPVSMADYYANPPEGSHVAALKNSMSASDWSKLAVPSAPINTGAASSGGSGLLSSMANAVGSEPLAEASSEKTLFQKILPSAAIMLGANLIPSPDYDVPDAASVYKNLIKSGNIPQYSGPLGQAAQAATLKNINSPDVILADYIEPYKKAITDDLNAREQEEIAMVRSIHVQNGTSGGSDEMRDIQRVQEKYRTYRGEQLGAIDQNLYNQRVSIYLQSIADAYGMDQANLATLAGLTNTTVTEAATRYGIKAQEVKDFRDALYQLAISVAPGARENTTANLLGKLFA